MERENPLGYVKRKPEPELPPEPSQAERRLNYLISRMSWEGGKYLYFPLMNTLVGTGANPIEAIDNAMRKEQEKKK